MVKRKQLTKAEERRLRKQRIKKAKRAKAKFRREQKAKRSYRPIKRDSRIYKDMTMMDLYTNWDLFGRVRVFTRDPEGKIDYDAVFSINKGWFKKHWVHPVFAVGSQDFKIEMGWTIYATKVMDVTANRIEQSFRDGDEHCVFQPIIDWLKAKKEEVKSVGTKKNYQTQINKVEKYMRKYDSGLPEENMQEVCDDLKINITIKDILQNTLFSVKCVGKARHTFDYINIRDNHLIGYCNIKDVIEVNEDEMRALAIKYQGNCYYRGNSECPRWLGCADGNFKVANPDGKKIEEFVKRNELDKFAYFHKSDEEKSRFISEGVNFNAHCKFKDYVDGKICERDMYKAYANYRDCKYFMGFPTVMSNVYKLTDWSVEKVNEYLGYYQVMINSRGVNDNTRKILKKMGLFDGKYIFSSPMISFLSDCGYEFDFMFGTFCYKGVDIDISELVANKVYVKFVGKLNMKKFEDQVRCQPTAEFASFMKSKYENVFWNNYTEELEIVIKKDNVRTLNHIAGYFTDYCRIQTIEEMIKLDERSIIGFKLDGFVFYELDEGEEIEFNDEKFRPKDPTVNFSWGMSVFDKSEGEYSGCELSYSQYIMESGAGGCGKTHKNVVGRKNVLLTSRCWDLLLDKEKEYNIRVETINRMLGIQCEGYMSSGMPYPSVIFVDELTQIDKGWVYSLINLYPYSQIILGGDVDEDGFGYQCKFKDVELFSDKRFEWISNTTNYRCKDKKLAVILSNVRKLMKGGKSDKQIRDYLYKVCMRMPRGKVGFHYDYKKDWILGSVNSLNAEWDASFASGRKYACQRHNIGDVMKLRNGEQAYLKGQIVYEEKPEVGQFKIQHAYTIHGFQGKTIRGGKLFFDMRRIFDLEQYYTALSRVEYLDQVVLVY